MKPCTNDGYDFLSSDSLEKQRNVEQFTDIEIVDGEWMNNRESYVKYQKMLAELRLGGNPATPDYHQRYQRMKDRLLVNIKVYRDAWRVEQENWHGEIQFVNIASHVVPTIHAARVTSDRGTPIHLELWLDDSGAEHIHFDLRHQQINASGTKAVDFINDITACSQSDPDV